MHFAADNLKYLRKQKGWTQSELAERLGVKRAVIGAYEEKRADPRLSLIQLICQLFEISMDAFINHPIDGDAELSGHVEGANLRVLPIAVDKEDNEERITLVPVKAAAGYLNGYGDIDFVASLPMFDLPFPEVSRGKTYRSFQIDGDSMLPIPSGTYILSSYLMDWNHIINDELYIVVTKSEGVVFKRVLNEIKQQKLVLKSDNPAYETFEVPIEDVVEVWKAEGMTSFDLDAIKTNQESAIMDELKALSQRLVSIENTKGNA